MSRMPIATLLSGVISKIVFVAALGVGYFVTPQRVRTGPFMYLSIPFILLFAITSVCIYQTIRERVRSSRQAGAPILGIVASVLGLSALQVCGLSAPFCGMTAGMGVLAMMFPGFLFHFLEDYSVVIVILSIVLQIISLFAMGCFTPRRSKH